MSCAAVPFTVLAGCLLLTGCKTASSAADTVKSAGETVASGVGTGGDQTMGGTTNNVM